MTDRCLSEGEITLARSLFGDAIDYDAASVSLSKWAFFQPKATVMAPTGCIHFHPKGPHYREDFAKADPDLQALFIHEMTHVWQHQRGVCLPLARHPFCRYRYLLTPGRRFERYGLEQQAEIARHAFLLRRGRIVPGAPPIGTYESVLPFRPA